MVSIGEHDHGDGELCPGCRFKARLADYLNSAAEDGVEEWHTAVGILRAHLYGVLVALARIEAQPFADDDDPDDDPAADAATAIAAVGSEIQHLWHTLVDDDRQGGE